MKATSGTIFSRQNTKCSFRLCHLNEFFKFHRKRLPVPVLVMKKNRQLKAVEKTFAKSSKIRNSVNQPKQLPSLKLIVENVQLTNKLFLMSLWKLKKMQLWRHCHWILILTAKKFQSLQLQHYAKNLNPIKLEVSLFMKLLKKQNIFLSIWQNDQDFIQVLFTDRCRWQTFRPSLLPFVNNCVVYIYKM